MKYLYIVDYWVPFPASEGGGLINLIAQSDTEAFELLVAENQFDDRYTDRIMDRVVNAQKFGLVDEYESGILEAFTT
jgi:succinate dehydrogenase flavin-adding protein (antitoxin of CptAB toxin-antitoxin module)